MLERLSCSQRHESISGATWGAIFWGKDAAGNNYRCEANFRVVFRPPEPGEVWTIKGVIEVHPKYGQQIHVESALLEKLSGKLIVDYLVNNPAFKGTSIGRKKAERLWDEYGDELYDILRSGDSLRLVESGLLTETTAAKLIEAWKKVADGSDVIPFLAHYGFDVRLANKVRRVWLAEAIKKIQENPYRMLAFASWSKVDGMARSLGVQRDDQRRQIAAVEAFLYQRLEEKHTLTPEDVVLSGISASLRLEDRAEAETCLRLALRDKAIVRHTDGYQPLGAAVMERVVTESLRALMLGARQPNLYSTCLDTVIAETVRGFEKERTVVLNAEQRAAIEMAVKQPLSVITGGAGVGKTTVLSVIHEVCEKTGTTVIQVALSGRAAQRLRDATGREASTIAKLLRSVHTGKNAIPKDSLVIIDESSMLDLPLTFSIVRALPEDSRLLLVGDPYQLPPIGFGLVFNVLVNNPRVPRAELTAVHRQAKSTGIPHIALSIRNGIIPDLPQYQGEERGVFFINSESGGIIDRLYHTVDQLKGHAEIQIISATKRGESGVRNVNSIFHSIYSTGAKRVMGRELAEGDPIIHLVNNYETELWNGSLGKVKEVNGANTGGSDKRQGQSLTCIFEGVEHIIPSEDFENIDLAYAITVHKAQGSQFQKVIIPIVKNRLLDRTLIYTALTRGVEQVIFIGDHRVFENAVREKPKTQGRMVGFTFDGN